MLSCKDKDTVLTKRAGRITGFLQESNRNELRLTYVDQRDIRGEEEYE